MKKHVAVFGIFDGVHDGHRDFFKQARELGDDPRTRASTVRGELIVIVGRDEIAEELKGKKPKHSENERVEMLKKEPFVDQAVLGDRELSTYTVLERCNPGVVCLGYDQQELHDDLQKWLAQTGKNIKLYRAKPYQNGALHNSLLTQD